MMDVLKQLLLGGDIASSMFVLALVVTVGTALSKVKVRGFSLGVTWVLFVGILMGHLGLSMDPHVLSFVKESGMILFIFGIGMIVGPGFFATFKQGGVSLNLLSIASVFFSLVVTYLIYRFSSEQIATLMGILGGAVTNTPSLASAQETARMLSGSTPQDIGIGYALGYPVAIIGMVVTLSIIKWVFKIDVAREEKELEEREQAKKREALVYSLEVTNPALFGMDIYHVKMLLEKHEVVISRILHEGTGEVEMASSNSKIYEGDKLLVISEQDEVETIAAFVGRRLEMSDATWFKLDNTLVSHRVLVTHPNITGKSIEQLKFRTLYNVNVSRLYRAGVHLIAKPDLRLQVGDTVVIVGQEEDVKHVEKILGNSATNLRRPNLLVLFLALLLGVLVGSLEIQLSGMSMPVKLGFSGGTLIVAILLSNFGTKFRLNTHNTESANMMIREIGITLFLACVGLSVGGSFVEKLMSGGFVWMGYAALMMMIPLWITLVIGRLWLKLDYFTLLGYVAGNMTFAPALSLTPDATKNNIPSVVYATVYPVTLFLRVMAAQWMILLLT